jgi:hypothetical protein
MPKKMLKELKLDATNSNQIKLFAYIALSSFARNTSTFFPRVLGLYLLANGTPRRVVDTLSHMGLIVSYSTLNNILDEMAE